RKDKKESSDEQDKSAVTDVVNRLSFGQALLDKSDPVSRFIFEHLKPETQDVLGVCVKSYKKSEKLKAALVEDINGIIKKELICQEDDVRDFELRAETRELLRKGPKSE